MSPNQGQVWNLMAGGVGNPLIVNDYVADQPNVNPVAGPTPNGAQGRIVLAVPDATGNAAQDPIYAGWLYAAVATPAGSFDGLFVTKDFGQNWTKVRIPTLPPVFGTIAQAIATNDVSQPDYRHPRRAPVRPGQLRHDPGRRPDQPQPSSTWEAAATATRPG